MTGKERMQAALLGEPVDRIPIWLREGFELDKSLPSKENFLRGWKQDPLYREILEHVEPHVDMKKSWGLGDFLNRFLMIPPRFIHFGEPSVEGERLVRNGTIVTPRGSLTYKNAWMWHNGNSWMVEYPVNSLEELKMVAEVPFDVDRRELEQKLAAHTKARSSVGDRGVLELSFSSPIVVISGLMNLELFLELSYTERDYFHKLLNIITERILAVADSLFAEGKLETTVNIGGSEQCTPPLMAPQAFDEYVVPYDGAIIKRLKRAGVMVNVHCHGKVRHALKCMAEMGVDSTDPVEPPPAGDVSFEEARGIVGDRMTLVGNLEWDEFTHLTPGEIRKRVRKVCSLGRDRVILAASAGPTTHITPRVADNIKAFVDAGLEYG
jgi:uroporphyrinogen-III decarboxylase